MKRQLYITGLIFLILSAINFLGLVGNRLLNYGSWINLSETLIFVGIFCGLYLLTTRMNLKIDNSLKLPIIRTVLWTLIVSTELFFEPKIDGAPSYLLYLTNTALCTVWDTIFKSIPESVLKLFFVREYFLNIILFGLYEVGVIKVATLINDRVIHRKTD